MLTFTVRGYRVSGSPDVDLGEAPDPAGAQVLAERLRADGYACAYVAVRREGSGPPSRAPIARETANAGRIRPDSGLARFGRRRVERVRRLGWGEEAPFLR